jgi:hypothetical protein
MSNFHRTDSSTVRLLQFDGPVPDIFACRTSETEGGENEKHTIHLLPCIEEILGVRKGNEAILGLVN